MSPRLPRVSGKDTLGTLMRAGFILMRSKGSHHFVIDPENTTRWATVPVHGNEILPPKTLKSILLSTKLTLNEFIFYKQIFNFSPSP